MRWLRMDEDTFIVCALFFMAGLGFALGYFNYSLSHFDKPIGLTQQTGDAICHQLTNMTHINATAENGNLICTPYYDDGVDGSNIVIKKREVGR